MLKMLNSLSGKRVDLRWSEAESRERSETGVES